MVTQFLFQNTQQTNKYFFPFFLSFFFSFISLIFSLFVSFQIILVLKSLRLYGNSHITVTIQIAAHVLAYTNSCVNPVLYAFLSDNFRKAFRKVSKSKNQSKLFVCATSRGKREISEISNVDRTETTNFTEF